MLGTQAWESALVSWDDPASEDSEVSLWELERCPQVEGEDRHARAALVLGQQRHAVNEAERAVQRLRVEQAAVVLDQALATAFDDDDVSDNADAYAACAWFADEVSDEVAPGYSRVIACQMFLRRVLQRCRSGFYRSTDAVLDDLELILANCATYNADGSSIVTASRRMLERIRQDLDEAWATVGAEPLREQTRDKVQAALRADRAQQQAQAAAAARAQADTTLVSRASHRLRHDDTDELDEDDEDDEDDPALAVATNRIPNAGRGGHAAPASKKSRRAR